MAVKNVLGHTLEALVESIVAGKYEPGSSIPPEPTLCGALGVSPTVVREAVKSLAAKGMLVTGPKVGTRVLPSDQWNWFDPDVVAKPDGPAQSLPLHRAVLDAVIGRDPARAEEAILVLIDGAAQDIELVLGSRRKLPLLAAPAARLKGRGVGSTGPVAARAA